jgi:heat shock protein 5
MVSEAERFAVEDEAQHKHINALNSLSSFIYGFKTQLGDEDDLGGKLEQKDDPQHHQGYHREDRREWL